MSICTSKEGRDITFVPVAKRKIRRKILKVYSSTNINTPCRVAIRCFDDDVEYETNFKGQQ